MKKLLALTLALLTVGMLFAACGGSGNTDGSTKDYKEALGSVLSADELEAFPINSSMQDQNAANILAHMGIQQAQMRKFAISASLIIVNVHTVAIILPVQGQEEAIKTALNTFIEAQQKAQENYLPLQYEITKNAQVKTTETGEIILVMREDAVAVCAQIVSALK